MKLKQLEGHLGGLQQFPHPKVELEQYPTGPHIASRMLFTVFPLSLYSPSFFFHSFSNFPHQICQSWILLP
ncbi:Methyltransferase protein 5 [Spatholobus suberectus]|nr:Methyltransferase protein 5 [Spatholobus suberectus]